MIANLQSFSITPLSRDELPVDTVELARWMVGKCLVHDTRQGRVSGRIVETEAYPVGDSTSYAYRGLRSYNGALFRVRGHAYVRLVYGASYTINMSSEEEGVGAAVLFRAIEPLDGIDLMRARRPGAKLVDLARGPGRLCAAMAIGPEWDCADLCGGNALWIGRLNPERLEPDIARVASTKRIGLTREMHEPLRFYVPGSRFVSGPKRLLEPIGRNEGLNVSPGGQS
ncbi:DNA-3-methyladenine glycosylase [Trinickia terrae]|uniref:DNA-3-methyladenine glycosylase n=1 Tax=Trinickia terrae TaxID=2571161 RepID=UPI001F0D8689|nr:DNA-3-methyladenine glycosylase [Trinickia terrae]